MYCTRKVNEDLTWVGGNDRRLSVFEGVYQVPNGMSYNSYLLLDEKTVLFDTVDKAVEDVFFENVKATLAGRGLDYVVVSHMEPDHSKALAHLLGQYPNVTVVCNQTIQNMIRQFFGADFSMNVKTIAEGDTLLCGKHNLQFIAAPMVHWPEVMMTFDTTDQILFSADAFGTFGALNGALFADEVDFFGDHLAEARRYYTNIVGKFGAQVQAVLKKASALDIKMICPLHGFVWRKDFAPFVEKYDKWSRYEPEAKGVMLAYASVYGNTENAAEILACRLYEKGIPVKLFDVSITPSSDIIAASFAFSHLVFASVTLNAGIFSVMDALLRDIAAHNLQNRTVAFIENGTWGITAGKQMRQIMEPLKNMTVLEQTVSVKSALSDTQLQEIDALAEAIAQSM